MLCVLSVQTDDNSIYLYICIDRCISWFKQLGNIKTQQLYIYTYSLIEIVFVSL